MTTTNRFEDRLLDELRPVVAERPAPAVVTTRRRPRRALRLSLVAAGVVAVIGAIAIVSTDDGVAPSAYAVEPGANGAVTVTIRSLEDADGLQAKLREAGVPAVVDYVPTAAATCAAPPAGGVGGNAEGSGPSFSTGGAGPDDGPTLTPGPGGVPGEGPLVMGQAAQGSGADGAMTFTIDPGSLRPGEKVFITTSTGAATTIAMGIGTTKPAMPCSPSP